LAHTIRTNRSNSLNYSHESSKPSGLKLRNPRSKA